MAGTSEREPAEGRPWTGVRPTGASRTGPGRRRPHRGDDVLGRTFPGRPDHRRSGPADAPVRRSTIGDPGGHGVCRERVGQYGDRRPAVGGRRGPAAIRYVSDVGPTSATVSALMVSAILGRVRRQRVIALVGWLVFAPFLFEGMAMLDIRRRISRRRRFTTCGRTGGRACGGGHARVSSPERGAGLR